MQVVTWAVIQIAVTEVPIAHTELFPDSGSFLLGPELANAELDLEFFPPLLSPHFCPSAQLFFCRADSFSNVGAQKNPLPLG